MAERKCGTCRHWRHAPWQTQYPLVNERVGVCTKEVPVPRSYWKAPYIVASEGSDCPFWEPMEDGSGGGAK